MQNEKLEEVNNEINLKVVVYFLKSNVRLIVLMGIVGLLFSTAYVLLASKVYEANWLMQMAQFSSINRNGKSNINVEEPDSLLERLRIPTTYTDTVKQACGINISNEVGEYLNGKLKVQANKSVVSVVAMKLRASSPDEAKVCAQAIVEMIVQQQNKLIEERLIGHDEQLAQYQQALKEEQRQLELIKNGAINNIAYLAQLDKLSWLRERIDQLHQEVFLSKKYPAKLQAPINISNNPVSPKVRQVILLGVLLGLMMGVLYAVARKIWRNAVEA